jgi:hypothetical protein
LNYRDSDRSLGKLGGGGQAATCNAWLQQRSSRWRVPTLQLLMMPSCRCRIVHVHRSSVRPWQSGVPSSCPRRHGALFRWAISGCRSRLGRPPGGLAPGGFRKQDGTQEYPERIGFAWASHTPKNRCPPRGVRAALALARPCVERQSQEAGPGEARMFHGSDPVTVGLNTTRATLSFSLCGCSSWPVLAREDTRLPRRTAVLAHRKMARRAGWHGLRRAAPTPAGAEGEKVVPLVPHSRVHSLLTAPPSSTKTGVGTFRGEPHTHTHTPPASSRRRRNGRPGSFPPENGERERVVFGKRKGDDERGKRKGNGKRAKPKKPALLGTEFSFCQLLANSGGDEFLFLFVCFSENTAKRGERGQPRGEQGTKKGRTRKPFQKRERGCCRCQP